jgi:RNA polymerase sigma-70 factor, ECF subfamily
VFREEAGLLTATLVRLLGDFDVAEEIVQDTLLLALERWRRDGIPDRPGALAHDRRPPARDRPAAPRCARVAELRALGLTSNRAERALLERRLDPAVSPGGGG